MTAASGAVVVGLGNPDRGDDAVGPAVARRVAGRLPVRVVEQAEPTGLLDLWQAADVVVVVDAVVRAGCAPGTVVVLEAGAEAGPLTADGWDGAARGGTHALGLASVVELGRALGRLPRRLVLVGVAATRFEHGVAMSAPVLAAVDAAADAVRTALQPTGGGR